LCAATKSGNNETAFFRRSIAFCKSFRIRSSYPFSYSRRATAGARRSSFETEPEVPLNGLWFSPELISDHGLNRAGTRESGSRDADEYSSGAGRCPCAADKQGRSTAEAASSVVWRRRLGIDLTSARRSVMANLAVPLILGQSWVPYKAVGHGIRLTLPTPPRTLIAMVVASIVVAEARSIPSQESICLRRFGGRSGAARARFCLERVLGLHEEKY
jgi:hypothetical protein